MPFLYTRYDICPPSQEQEQGQDSYGHCMDDIDSKPPTTIQIVTFWLIFGMIASIILITLGIMVPPYLCGLVRSCLDVFRGKEEEKVEKGNSNHDSGGSVSRLALPVVARVDTRRLVANTGDGGDHGAIRNFLSRLYSGIFGRFGTKGKGKEEKEVEVERSVGPKASLEQKMDNDNGEGGKIASSKLYTETGLGVAKHPIHITFRRASNMTEDESVVG